MLAIRLGALLGPSFFMEIHFAYLTLSVWARCQPRYDSLFGTGLKYRSGVRKPMADGDRVCAN